METGGIRTWKREKKNEAEIKTDALNLEGGGFEVQHDRKTLVRRRAKEKKIPKS